VRYAAAVELNVGVLRLAMIPAMGAAIGRIDLLCDGSPVPLMRPMPAEYVDDRFSLACNLLLPWVNRISGGGAVPIHGNGLGRSRRGTITR